MPTWPAKDPEAVLDYLYTVPLDPGDTVAGTPSFVRIAGTVAIDSISFDPTIVTNSEVVRGQNLTVWLSGGEAGETSVFRIGWVTAGGRTNDDVKTLSVVDSDFAVLTGYAKPTAAHLQMRYPAFASVEAGTIVYWLADAERMVDTSWSQGDYAPALMSLAAHNMALAGLGSVAQSSSGVPAGITAMKSGSLSLNFTPEAANARMTGSLAATQYGQEYQMLLRRNRGGPRVSSTGLVPNADFSAGYSWRGWGGPC